MAYSRITYTYVAQTTFAINFTLGYLDEAHVTCRVNSEVDGGGNPVYRALTFITEGTVSVGGAALQVDDVIVFERTTPKNALQNDFQNGAILTETNLDDSYKQALMIAHEALDGRFSAMEQELDMNGLNIVNVAAAVNATDAVNLTQMTTAIAAAGGLGGSIAAAGFSYDNTTSLLAATNVQTAIDELDTDLDAVVASLGALAVLNTVGTAVIDAGAVTNVKLADMAQDTIKGRTSGAGTGDPVDLTAAQVNTILGTLPSIDEDTMVSNSAVHVPTQQSTKAYVDSKATLFGAQFLHLQDQKASGTEGGTFTSGAWQTRTLNTEVTDEIGSTLAANQFTLPAGTYYISAAAPAFLTDLHQTRLQNITDGTTALVGTSEYTDSVTGSGDGVTRSFVSGRITIAGTKTFELQHRCSTTRATNGFGTASSFGTEVYSNVQIWKVA